MLYLPSGSGLPVRVHGAFVSDEEVHRVVDYLQEPGRAELHRRHPRRRHARRRRRRRRWRARAAPAARADPMYDQAVAIVLQHRRASISLVQRHLRIGYNRAARLLEQMEKSGLVSAMATNGNRDILVPARANESARCSALRCWRCCSRRRPPRRRGRHAARLRARREERPRRLHADRHLARRREEEDLQRQLRVRAAEPLPLRLRQALRADSSSPTAQKVWIYDADLNQVSVAQAVAQALGATPAALLAGGSLDKDFELSPLPPTDGLDWVAGHAEGRRTAPSSRCASAFAARSWRRSRSSTASASARCCLQRIRGQRGGAGRSVPLHAAGRRRRHRAVDPKAGRLPVAGRFAPRSAPCRDQHRVGAAEGERVRHRGAQRRSVSGAGRSRGRSRRRDRLHRHGPFGGRRAPTQRAQASPAARRRRRLRAGGRGSPWSS